MLSFACLLRLPIHFVAVEVSPSAIGIHVLLASQAPLACCPSCHMPSTNRHSRYTRTAQDLAWSGQSVPLQVIWRCHVPACSQHIFAELLALLLGRSARMITRLISLLRTVTLATSGQSAARLTASIQPMLSPATLLRQIMALPDPLARSLSIWSATTFLMCCLTAMYERLPLG